VIQLLLKAFHALLARDNASAPSVIRIRIQGLKGDGVAHVIRQVVRAVEADLLAGAGTPSAPRNASQDLRSLDSAAGCRDRLNRHVCRLSC